MRNSILSFIVYPNLFIAFVAVMMSWEALYLRGITGSTYLWFIFFSTLLSYGFHSLVNTVYTDVSPRHDWNRRNKKLLFVLTGGSAVMASFFFLKHYRENPAPFIAGAALTFAYSAPNLPGKFFELLRKIAFGKTFFLALMWTYATAILPLLAEVPGANPFSAFVGSRFYLVYAICILFDMKDREDDTRKGIRALPTMLSHKAVSVFYWISLLIAVFFSFMETWPMISPTTLILLFPVIIMFFVSRFLKAREEEVLYYIFLDGLMMLSAILHAIYLFSITFVVV